RWSMKPVFVTLMEISMSVQSQKGECGNSMARSPISSAVYGGENGKRSSGRYGICGSRGVSTRRSSAVFSSAESSSTVFQVFPWLSFPPACTGETPQSSNRPTIIPVIMNVLRAGRPSAAKPESTNCDSGAARIPATLDAPGTGRYAVAVSIEQELRLRIVPLTAANHLRTGQGLFPFLSGGPATSYGPGHNILLLLLFATRGPLRPDSRRLDGGQVRTEFRSSAQKH